jgi:hypothetical protein
LNANGKNIPGIFSFIDLRGMKLVSGEPGSKRRASSRAYLTR